MRRFLLTRLEGILNLLKKYLYMREKKEKKEKYKPDLYCSGLWSVNFEELSQRGIRHLIIDVDSTIAEEGSCEIDPRVREKLTAALRDGIVKDACLLSNTLPLKCRKERVKSMARELGISCVTASFFRAKPGSWGFLKALTLMGASIENTAVIGDQMFTDVAGGNKLGMFTILVEPLGPVHWTTLITLLRWREKNLLRKMKNQDE